MSYNLLWWLHSARGSGEGASDEHNHAGHHSGDGGGVAEKQILRNKAKVLAQHHGCKGVVVGFEMPINPNEFGPSEADLNICLPLTSPLSRREPTRSGSLRFALPGVLAGIGGLG